MTLHWCRIYDKNRKSIDYLYGVYRIRSKDPTIYVSCENTRGLRPIKSEQESEANPRGLLTLNWVKNPITFAFAFLNIIIL